MKSNEKNFIKRLQRQKEDALEFVVDTYLPRIKFFFQFKMMDS